MLSLSVNIYFGHIIHYIRRGTAIADANRAISLDPKFSLAYYSRFFAVYKEKENSGKSQINRRRQELFLVDLNRSIALDPNFAYGYRFRSIFTTDRISSIRDLQKAAKILRQQGRFHALSGVIKDLLEKGATEME
jgi:hypothetical protein